MPRPLSIVCLVVLTAAVCGGLHADFKPLFNGQNLDGWRIVNTDSSTWSVRDGMIVCSGKPIGELCTRQQYENYVLELEWRHLREGGNAGLFLHSDPLPAVGQPFTRAIEAQVMDGNHGDVFAIHGATMVPDRPHPEGWMRSLPVEKRANPTGEWNHYRVESRDGRISLAVNGKVVSGGTEVSPRKGYICLESEGSEAHFRNIQIDEMPSTSPASAETAPVFEGHQTLYSGVDLDGWRTTSESAWKVDDWILRAEASGAPGSDLWTARTFGDFELIADWRAQCEEGTSTSAIMLRGSADARVVVGCANALAGQTNALAKASNEGADQRGWRRMVIRIEGDLAVIKLDGTELARTALPDGSPSRGAIGLAHHGSPMEFANLFVKELTP